MSVRDRVRRWHSPAVFGLIALCFLLPFGTVRSCDDSWDETEVSATGIQLVTHSVPRATGAWQSEDAATNLREDEAFTREVEKNLGPPAEIAFGAAILGLVLGLLGRAGGGWCAAVGLGALLWLAAKNYDVSGDDAGLKLALFLLVWAGIVHFIRWLERIRARGGLLDPPPADTG